MVNVLPYIYTLNGLYLLSKRVVFALGHLCEAKLENKSCKSFVYHDHGFSRSGWNATGSLFEHG